MDLKLDIRLGQRLPPPPRLFSLYERGEISHEQWIDGMRMHCMQALQEIQRDRIDPQRAWMETLRCKMAAKRLLKAARESEIREVLVALSWVEDFPLANYLWNADQTDSPLHCFLRETTGPIFRVLKLEVARLRAEIQIEYGSEHRKLRVQEGFVFRRDWRGQLSVESRY